ncbi:hypothetical protein BI344_20680 [Chromobacterium sphagni]|uniref:Uncharacterized protein n=1 Tax=Chromobacterium sphagni TaxID=1903179 RepID=A0ABX3C8U2_9NEIS|nr:hypothetical protein BI344_20680 [Chromobacterium sphagni]
MATSRGKAIRLDKVSSSITAAASRHSGQDASRKRYSPIPRSSADKAAQHTDHLQIRPRLVYDQGGAG